jgi:hypothetical protein
VSAIACQQYECSSPSYMSDSRLEWHMWNWEQWQFQQRGHYGRGYPSRGLSGMGASGSSDLDAMIATADRRCAEAVEVVLNDLAPALRCAVHAVHLAAVFRFRDDVESLYDRATEAVRRWLMARGIQ